MTQQELPRTRSATGTYSEAVGVEGQGRLIHVAGQLGASADGTGADDTMAVQTARAFAGLEQALLPYGARLEHLVKITVFVTSLASLPDFNEVRLARLGSRLPASTIVAVSGLIGGSALEIEAVAFVPAADLPPGS